MADTVIPVGYTNGTTFVWNTKGQVVAAAVILPFLGIVLVGLRFYSRIKNKAGLGADDWLILPALMLVIGLGVTLLVGVGRHVVAHTTAPNPVTSPEAQLHQISPSQELLEKIEFVFYTTMIPAYGFIKLSVICFYRRVFVSGTTSRFDIVTKVSIAVVSLWTIAFFFLQVFKCGAHMSYNWGPLVEAERCTDPDKIASGLFISDFLTDFLVLMLPIPIIVRLNMTTTRKLQVIAVLMLGAMSFCAAIVRMVFNFQISAAGLSKPTDVDEGLTTLLYWGMLEAGLSLIAACLPSVYVIFAKSSLQSIIASIRSAISLHSIRSDRSRGSRKPYEDMENASTASHVRPLKQQTDNSSHIYSGYEMDEASPEPVREGEIHVRSKLSQSEKMV